MAARHGRYLTIRSCTVGPLGGNEEGVIPAPDRMCPDVVIGALLVYNPRRHSRHGARFSSH